MFFAWGVGLANDVAYLLTPLSSQGTSAHPGKTRSYEPKTRNETMLPMRRKKSFAISHISQHKTLSIITLISTKEKEWGREKIRRLTLEARKNKQMKKQEGRNLKKK